MDYLELPINRVELDRDNPRIKQFLSIYSGEPTSNEIALALMGGADKTGGSSKYAALRESINKNGGIFTPIIVNHIVSEDRYIVIEGNTRLKFYQEFYSKTHDKQWSTIISIVYDDMSDDEIHAIRLQAHMVGARDWDPFSKAKYLDYLYNSEKRSMEYLKVFCGGQESQIRNLINAYNNMNEYYAKKMTEKGEKVDPQLFSYYYEAQGHNCQNSLAVHGYDLEDFTNWVVTEKIERAEHVRSIAKILEDEDARTTFLREGSSSAMKKLDSKEINQKKLKNTDLYKLVHEVAIKLRNITNSEVKKLRLDPKYSEKKEVLCDLYDEIKVVLKDIGEEPT